ncbi:MAG: protein kinase [Planctomycetaceae bacterium]
MSAESWKSNWEVVKRIGEGGQGTVDLVKRRSISDTTGDLHLKLRKTLQELTSNVFAAPPDHEKAAKELVDTLSLLTFRGGELGALKRLKNPETARDPRHAKFRQKREIDVLLQQTNPHLLRLLDVDQEQNWYVSAYCDGGDLKKNQTKFLGDALGSLEALRPIIAAVAMLHKEKIVHRDIKPENIYADANGQLVLGDFGLVHFIETTESRVTGTYDNVGSWEWMPVWAQARRQENVSMAFDVYSLAKLIWFTIGGKHPFHLWYFNNEDNNLEEQFPEDPAMPIVNELLSQCIVEKEEDCLADASMLLQKLDRVISRIRNRGRVLYGDGLLNWTCQVCANGKYEKSVDRNVTSAHNFGLNPTGSGGFLIFKCNYCGHLQFFSVCSDSDRPLPPGWVPPSKLPR